MNGSIALELRNVTKRFGPVVANKDVSFSIHHGEILAILGENGSGKTTLMNMIAGIYYPDDGEILIDGIDVRKIKLSSLRRHFGQMLQDVFLFSGTIRSNIILRDESISDERVREVCEYVNADKFINKP